MWGHQRDSPPKHYRWLIKLVNFLLWRDELQSKFHNRLSLSRLQLHLKRLEQSPSSSVLLELLIYEIQGEGNKQYYGSLILNLCVILLSLIHVRQSCIIIDLKWHQSKFVEAQRSDSEQDIEVCLSGAVIDFWQKRKEYKKIYILWLIWDTSWVAPFYIV